MFFESDNYGIILSCKDCNSGFHIYTFNETDDTITTTNNDVCISVINNCPKTLLNKLKAIWLILTNKYIGTHDIWMDKNYFKQNLGNYLKNL